MRKTVLYMTCLLVSVMSACDDMNKKTEATHDEATEATADTAVAFENENEPDSAADGTIVDVDASGDADWNDLDMDVDMPAVNWPEFKDGDVEVRGNDKYSVYSLGENVLFDTDKAEIKKGAEANLQKISSSIAQRSKDGDIRIYGYTDAKGSAGYNEDLAKRRAEAVKNWLQKNGKIDASRISVHPVGEAKPVKSNETAAGRQQNRRVEIAVRNS
ncbi:OmpA family protein [Pontibacter sp. KCTC 32443]|uniref:OmpA family protein n=1 Tax=Pontibacter TaxID=323449 RepID=UPI00164DBD1F|nr:MULTISPECIES: OmpA family protein [Pontibacter]MBC5775715.1 OmpA family protein [Pontibacter sp. KCTC 32443]